MADFLETLHGASMAGDLKREIEELWVSRDPLDCAIARGLWLRSACGRSRVPLLPSEVVEAAVAPALELHARWVRRALEVVDTALRALRSGTLTPSTWEDHDCMQVADLALRDDLESALRGIDMLSRALVDRLDSRLSAVLWWGTREQGLPDTFAADRADIVEPAWWLGRDPRRHRQSGSPGQALLMGCAGISWLPQWIILGADGEVDPRDLVGLQDTAMDWPGIHEWARVVQWWIRTPLRFQVVR